MKRRLLAVALALCMTFSTAAFLPPDTFEDTGITASAEIIKSGDFEYQTLSDGTVELTEYTGTAQTLAVPETIDGKTVSRLMGWTFSGNTTLKRVTIGGSIKEIGAYSFYNCTALTSVTIKSGLETIGTSAFRGCSQLSSISLASSVKTIEEDAFVNTKWIQEQRKKGSAVVLGGFLIEATPTGDSFTVPSTVKVICSNAFYYSNVKSVTLPSGLLKIDSYAFYKCGSIESLTIPASVTQINTPVFYNCDSITAINVASGNKNFASSDGVLYDKNKTRLICCPVKKTTVTIPSTVTEIGLNAFDGCTVLKSAALPSGLKTIENYAFRNCAALASVNIPSGVTNIGSYAFAGCQSIKSAVIPKNVKQLGENTFSDCTSLSSVTIPEGVESIDYYCFYNCPALKTVTVPKSVTRVSPKAFGYIIDTQTKKAVVNTAFTMKCYKDSSAESYCMKNGLNYELIDSTQPEGLAQSNAVKIDASVFTPFSSDDFGFAVYGNDKNNGIYVLNQSKLWFIAVKDGKSSLTYDFSSLNSDKITSSYLCGSKLYAAGNHYDSTLKKTVYRIYIYDLDARKLLKQISLDVSVTAVAADSKGNIFAAGQPYIYMFDSSGKKLSEAQRKQKVYRFTGYDETNGNLYFESAFDYYSWGYHHDMNGLFSASVKDNQITVNDKYIDMFYQLGFYGHNNSSELLCGKYLAYANNSLKYIDSNSFDLSGDSAPLLFSTNRPISEDGENTFDVQSYGIRAVYSKSNDSFISYMNDNKISEFDLGGNEIAQMPSVTHVFSLNTVGDNIVAIERHDSKSYYLEVFPWKHATSISVTAPSSSLSVAGTMQLTAKTNGTLTESYTWTSSDSKIGTVSADGKVYGVSVGTATVTVSTSTGLKTTYKVTVTANSALASPDLETVTTGASSSNASMNDYTVWSQVNNSYIYEDSSKNIWRAEYIGSSIIAEKYSAGAKTLLSKYTVTPELSIFGGIYFSSDYNYVVTGKENPSYSDSSEVVRITRYTKDWKKKDHVSINGANTYVPFEAGSCRFAEADGKIYIHTCHKMYADSDGINHQANMTFVLDKSTMKITDSQYEVHNLTSGYVSHSFDQFVLADNGFIYRVDHAEGANMYMGSTPLSTRGITISKISTGDSLTAVDLAIPLKVSGGSGNYTGIALGGFEITKQSCIIAYTKDIGSNASSRDVYLSVVDKQLSTAKAVKLTDYSAATGVYASTPQLVRVSDYLVAVLWEEKSSAGKTAVKAILVDGDGNICSNIGTLDARLSDCQPIMCSDGCIRWYYTTSGAPKICAVQPFEINNFHIHQYTVTSTKQPTCTAAGSQTKKCSVCGKTVTETIKATGHKWAAPTYTWSSDNKTCTAARVCTNDKTHTETETVTAVYSVTKQPTCTAKGTGKYTAVFKNTAFVQQTKNTDIALKAHTFGAWTNSGFNSAKGVRLQSRTCSVCKTTETREINGAVTRLAGKGRYATAAEISKAAFTSANTVILADGMNYADALAGVPLAKKLGAPILLTGTNTLAPETLAEIKRLKATNVIIIGGEGAVSENVRKELESNGLTTRRIAGRTRFGTAAAIAGELGSAPTDVFFVYGLDYADALSVSPVAAAKNAPIIYLTTSGELNADTAAYLETIKGKVKNAYVIGGDGVITDDMMNKAAQALGLDKATRVAGKNRFLTCVQVNKAFASVLTSKSICIATGLDFPDALAGGVYAAKNSAGLFLINGKTNPPTFADEQKSYFKALDPNSITIFGGTGVVPDAHVDALAKR